MVQDSNTAAMLSRMKQVSQQAWKTHIPPHGLKQRRRLQFRLQWPLTSASSSCANKQMAHTRRTAAAAVTPREPKFTKRGEALSG